MVSWLLFLALFAISRRSDAQQAAPAIEAHGQQERAAIAAQRVTVTTDDTHLRLTIALPGQRTALVSCNTRCSFWAAPGDYILWATSSEVRYQTTLHVGARSTFKVNPGHPTARTVSLAIAIAAPAISIGALAWGLAHFRACGDDEECRRDSAQPIAFDLFVGGLVLTPIAWLIYAQSGPHVDAVETQRTFEAAPVRLGVATLPSGLGLGLSGAF